MSKMHNSPLVRVKYTYRRPIQSAFGKVGSTSGFDAEFVIGWSHNDGFDKFCTELTTLIDSLHESHKKGHESA